MRKLALSAACLVSVALTSGCALNSTGNKGGGAAASGPLKGVHLTVGGKEFTEQLIMCELTAERLESQGASVKRTCALSGTNAVRAALTSGSVDMYWEYTGTGWLNLQQSARITDPAAMYGKVAGMDKAKNNIIWLPPAPANDTYGVAVKSAVATRLGVRTISDYARLAKTQPDAASFCAAAEFVGRDDGWPGLQKAYGFQLPKSKLKLLAAGPIYNAINKSNPCNFGEVFTTDGRIAALHLTVLTDDKHYFAPFNLSLNVRGAVLSAHPAIDAAMAPVSKLLTSAELQKLNAEVDVAGKTPEEVASEWLTRNHLK